MSEKSINFIGPKSLRDALKAWKEQGNKNPFSDIGSPVENMHAHLSNIQMVKSLPDHVIMMINNMPEHSKDTAHEVIQKMIDQGYIVVARWTSQPPIEQRVDDHGRVSYHLPPLDIGVKV